MMKELMVERNISMLFEILCSNHKKIVRELLSR